MSRRIGEKIVIGDGIVVTVVEVHRDSVRLGVDAPRSVPVNRAELVKAVSEENVAAMSIDASALTSLRGIRPTAASPLDLRKLIQKSALAQGAVVGADIPGKSGESLNSGTAIPGESGESGKSGSAIPGNPSSAASPGKLGATSPENPGEPGNSGTAIPGKLGSAASGGAAGASTPSAAPGFSLANPAAGAPGSAIPKPRPIPKPRDPRRL